MAAPDNKTELNHVLRYYKNSSKNSLHGPSSLDCNNSKKFLDDNSYLPLIYNSKACDNIQYQSPDEEKGYKKQIDIWDNIPAVGKPCAISSTADHDGSNKKNYRIPPSLSNRDVDLQSKTKDTYLKEKPMKKHDSESPNTSPNCYDEPGVFLTPAPFPPKPLPVLTMADEGDPCLGGVTCETMLYNKAIVCFDIGGEKRLCLPQVFSLLLNGISWPQINAVMEESMIYCSVCTPRQLDILKKFDYLPQATTSCGLITKTDAQRLTHILKHQHEAIAMSISSQKQLDSLLKISHNCFGKSKGAVWLDFYDSPTAPCIQCMQCNLLFTPDKFVCHVHRNLETNTVHWGFDAEHWRSYLMLSKQQSMDLHKAEQQLDAFKSKFLVNGAPNNHKRKQLVDVKCDLAKKVRADDIHLQYNGHDDLYTPQSIWRAYQQNMPQWAATPLLTRDGKPLPPPPAAFVRDSMRVALPANLSQGPPVLVDPGRVVPLSESEKFERHYQPNVALAPPKLRDKMAREAAAATALSNAMQHQHAKQRLTLPKEEAVEIVEVKIEEEEIEVQSEPYVIIPKHPPDPCKSQPSPAIPGVVYRSCDDIHRATAKSSFSPETANFHPDLELSTTDSDTESAVSVSNKSELVEEVESLLTGWDDKASAAKVFYIVEHFAQSYANSRKMYLKEANEKSELKHRIDRQSRQQFNTQTENELKRRIVQLENELKANREKCTMRSSPMVPLVNVKIEPFENGTC